MDNIQFISITPDALADLIYEKLDNRFKEVTNNLVTKTPTEYLSRQEVAKMLKMNVSTVHNLSVRGILQKYQISGRVLYKRSEVESAIVKLNN